MISILSGSKRCRCLKLVWEFEQKRFGTDPGERERETIHHRYLRDLTSSTGDKVEGRESVPLK